MYTRPRLRRAVTAVFPSIVGATLVGCSMPNSSITLMPESEATRKVAKGNLMALRSRFTVTLADYGVSHPVIGKKVAKDVDIDVSLVLSTLPRERQ